MFGERRLTVLAVGVLVTVTLQAQNAGSSPLAIARALDGEISNLKSIPPTARAKAITALAGRIRQQPKEFVVALADNLARDGADGTGDNTLVEIADTLAEALRTAPQKANNQAYITLANLVRYGELPTALNDPHYTTAVEMLERAEKHRSRLDFTLPDLRGHAWRLKGLKGKVVLVNFWATWCPPCRLEVTHLIELQHRFANSGLEILAISDEEGGILRRFVAENKVNYKVLLDPGRAVRDLYRVSGVPETFVYDRQGRLVAQAPASPSMQRLLRMLERAGLRP